MTHFRLFSLVPAFAAVATLLPLAAGAQQQRNPNTTFAVPAGCEARLTVQGRACVVSHHFTCSADPEGYQRRIDINEEGPVYVGMIDAETQWIESRHLRSGLTEQLLPNPADPASLSDLIATGRDDYDFSTTSSAPGQQPFVMNYRGYDRLTGETLTVDGETLDQTEFSIRAFDAAGQLVWQSEGNEYISREWRHFLSGSSTISTSEDTFTDDNSPVRISRPGEAGFLSAVPAFGCGDLMSSLPQPPSLKESRHEQL
ncbi:hypothetical protein [Ketogulonicigenium vulgare]|uniref:Uncharacterized protein n=1 Tax=Ketogulonicigenium vulgare (strain WSH-001) TaxID=759362 RepID=F9Y4I4_KETVW|nr:hypothetical protein [Ketogulonicigenium vulgare]ADO43519.1 conserved hypothetical protein [Ketogulonicigenium vulgare Y25]AEM41797.1 hypothetical protein KVU_1958 [Ketogulonicigenium vulgare WSH-001]ALJ81903.1 hypothetical protein KVH_12455 [Ketogulonicigenium vulgare]ANW34552.1 hypothetical protein KvSKV_12375 [Ketogulonicigenium vulgare]AOZ55554.1 hypothetical protein KVC_2552 [Ketogulonicigenium vulgare]